MNYSKDKELYYLKVSRKLIDVIKKEYLAIMPSAACDTNGTP
jgi:hypothetical protein